MKLHPTTQSGIWPRARRRRPRGTSMLDLLVAFTLLVTLISAATPLIVRHSLLLASQRHYRLALDELTNQMERLTDLPAGGLPAAVEELEPSPFVAERLHGTELSGYLRPAEGSTQITLQLSWNQGGNRTRPLTLSAWVFHGTPSVDGKSKGDRP